MAIPGQYTRTDPFATQLAKQQADAAAKAAADKAKRAQEKTKKDLQSAKQREEYYKAAKISADKDLAYKKKATEDFKAGALLPSSDGGVTITPAELAAYNSLVLVQKTAQKNLDSANASYKAAYTERVSLENSLVKKTTIEKKKVVKDTKAGKTKDTKTTTTSLENGSSAPNIPNPIKYYYNAPMPNFSYLSANGPQQQTSTRPVSAPHNVNQALESWADPTAGSKGIIQMDSTQVYNNANYANNDTGKYDGKLYGFKFLYNPKEVNMTWAVAEGMNWEGIQAGLDPGTAPTTALNNSTISFTLLLNRINDMYCLTPNGLKAGTNPYPSFNIAAPSINEELAQIYQKGTMYDLEYLFKAIAGLNSTYTTAFNDISSDVGWLYGFSAELHLGNKMRYKVRLTSLEVNHAMFDERMVPILSYVNVSFARFPNINAPK